MGGIRSADRGVSEVVGYVLSVAIVGMVVVGIVVSAGSYFDRRQAVAVGSELEAQGQQVARTIGIVDRLARQSDSSGEIGRTVDLPSQIGDERYSITVINRSRASAGDTPCDRSCLLLSTDDVRRTVSVVSVTTLEGVTVTGESLYVVRPSGETTIRFDGTG